MNTKLEIIDTHCHIYSKNLFETLDDVIQRSNDAGVNQIYMPNIDDESIDDMLAVESRYSFCKPMMGLHPCSVNSNFSSQLKTIENWLNQRKFFGIGETGIDLYWDKTYFEEQKKAFDYQIALALEYNLPIIIHSRESLDITIDMISHRQNGNLTGVFHCFGGTIEQAKKIENLGFMMGLGGVITYKNSGMIAVIPEINQDYIVLETDAPYLSPVPMRGKDNEPSFINFVVEKLAEFRQEETSYVAQYTTANAKKLFQDINS